MAQFFLTHSVYAHYAVIQFDLGAVLASCYTWTVESRNATDSQRIEKDKNLATVHQRWATQCEYHQPNILTWISTLIRPIIQ